MDRTELALLAGRGDKDAFAKLYNAKKNSVNWWLYSHAYTEHNQDIAQQIWIGVWNSLPTFEGRCRFDTWFEKVVHNRYVDCIRHLDACNRLKDNMVQEGERKYEPYLGDAGSLIECLPHESWREVFTQRYILGYSLSEISRMTGVHREALASRHRKGIAWLRKHPEVY